MKLLKFRWFVPARDMTDFLNKKQVA